MGGARHVVPCGNHAVKKIHPPRVRIGLKYGRDRGRRLAAIQCAPAAQPMFRQALLVARDVRLVLPLDELLEARGLFERGEPCRGRPPGRPLLDTSTPRGRERGSAANQPSDEERAKPLAAFGIHEAIVGSERCSARWEISSST